MLNRDRIIDRLDFLIERADRAILLQKDIVTKCRSLRSLVLDDKVHMALNLYYELNMRGEVIDFQGR